MEEVGGRRRGKWREVIHSKYGDDEEASTRPRSDVEGA